MMFVELGQIVQGYYKRIMQRLSCWQPCLVGQSEMRVLLGFAQ